MSETQRLVALGVPLALAAEIDRQIENGAGNAGRLVMAGLPELSAKTLAGQIASGVTDGNRLAASGMIPEVAGEIMKLIDGDVLRISGTAPQATEGVAYSWTPTVAGGTSPYAFAISAGALPDGLTIDAGTGEVSGTPSLAGSYPLTIEVTDADNDTASLSVELTVAAAGPGPDPEPEPDLLGPATFVIDARHPNGPYADWSESAVIGEVVPDQLDSDPLVITGADIDNDLLSEAAAVLSVGSATLDEVEEVGVTATETNAGFDNSPNATPITIPVIDPENRIGQLIELFDYRGDSDLNQNGRISYSGHVWRTADSTTYATILTAGYFRGAQAGGAMFTSVAAFGENDSVEMIARFHHLRSRQDQGLNQGVILCGTGTSYANATGYVVTWASGNDDELRVYRTDATRPSADTPADTASYVFDATEGRKTLMRVVADKSIVSEVTITVEISEDGGETWASKISYTDTDPLTGLDVGVIGWASASVGVNNGARVDRLYAGKAGDVVIPGLGRDYFVDGLNGDDDNDGSQSTPFKHAPSDPGAAGTRAGSIQLFEGDTVNFANGQRHRAASFGDGRSTFLALSQSGTVDHKIQIKGYGAGDPFVIAGDEVTTDWATVSSAQTFGNPAGDAGKLYRRDVDGGLLGWEAPFEDDVMLWPCQWPQPVVRSAVNETGQAYWHPSDNVGVLSWSGESVDPDTGSANTLILTLVDPASRPVSMVGSRLLYRQSSSNVQTWVLITHHDVANGIIKGVGTASGAPTLSTGMRFAIRAHPYDIVKGTFGMVPMVAPFDRHAGVIGYFEGGAGSQKSLSRLNTALAVGGGHLQVEHWHTSGFTSSSTSAAPMAVKRTGSSTPSVAISDIVAVDYSTPPLQGAWQGVADSGNGVDLDGVVIRTPTGGIKVPQPGATVSNIDISGISRTAIDIRTTSNVTMQYVNLHEITTTHGNGLTCYYGPTNVVIDTFRALGVVRPVTMGNQHGSGPQDIHISNGCFVHIVPRVAPLSPGNFRDGTVPAGFGSNGHIDGLTFDFCLWAVGYVNISPKDTRYDENPTSVWRNQVFASGAVLSSLDPKYTASGETVVLENVVFYKTGEGMPSPQDLATLRSRGATIVGGDTSVVYLEDYWTGEIVPAAWEVLTRDSDTYHGELDGTPAYKSGYLGPDWLIPAWGTTIASADMDCQLTTLEIAHGQPQWATFASVWGYPPSVAISLPAGVDDNDDFDLWGGQLRPKADFMAAAGGTITLTVRLTPNATGGATFQSEDPVDVQFVVDVVAR